jgi:hypothetical protein
LWKSLCFSAVASLYIKIKKPAAAAICGDADAYTNTCTMDGSEWRTRSWRAPSRGGVKGEPRGGATSRAAPHHRVPYLTPSLTLSPPRRNRGLILVYKYFLVSYFQPFHLQYLHWRISSPIF